MYMSLPRGKIFDIFNSNFSASERRLRKRMVAAYTARSPVALVSLTGPGAQNICGAFNLFPVSEGEEFETRREIEIATYSALDPTPWGLALNFLCSGEIEISSVLRRFSSHSTCTWHSKQRTLVKGLERIGRLRASPD